MSEHARLIFSTAADAPLAEKLCALGVGVPGDIERETFPDGERGLRLASRVVDSDAFLVGGTGSDADTLELYDLGCALVEYGVHALTLVVPYFGYSTQERPSKEGESVTAKNRARLLSSIPLPDGGLRVLLVDLHTAGLPFYFEGGLRPVHVTARSLFAEAIRAHAPGGCVVVSVPPSLPSVVGSTPASSRPRFGSRVVVSGSGFPSPKFMGGTKTWYRFASSPLMSAAPLTSAPQKPSGSLAGSH